jgi:hypothetical protein
MKNILIFFMILVIFPKRKIIECAIKNVNFFCNIWHPKKKKKANAKERRCNNWVFLLMGILLMHGR